jgi:outer membrane receptor for ferrienterochelin and colicins
MQRFLSLLVLMCAVAGAPSFAADAEETSEDVGEITITATRSHRLVRDQAVRVEVVPQEELEEAQTVAPGNLTNLLNELAGAHLDTASAGLGGTSMRLRGLPGRHAQVLTDGLALGGAQSDSFSFLQAPPVDLKRVEVVKGVASALYGGSAVAGVLNLVSRPPDDSTDLIFGQTSLGGSDLGVFLSGSPSDRVGWTVTGSANYQTRRDPDRDGWAELPGYERVTLRPRWFMHDDAGGTTFATLGFTGEDREGGTMRGGSIPGGGAFALALETRRVDGGVVTSRAHGAGTINAKASASIARHARTYAGSRIEDDATALAAEANYQARAGAHEWTVGAALQYDSLDVQGVPGVGHAFTVPALYAQDEISPTRWLSLSGSARLDFHDEYGTFLSPRLSALFRLDPDVSLRASVGTGYAPATPALEEIDETGFGVLEPLGKLRAERATSASLDLTWIARPFDVNLSVFDSKVRNPLDAGAAASPGRVRITNDREPFEARGAELLIGCTIGEAHVLANTTWLDATEQAPGGGRRDAELLPAITSELAAIFELEGRGRAGFELSYTGAQPVFDDPFRTRSPSRIELNALAELTFGRFSIFANAFNILGEHQQDDDPLLRPAGTTGPGGSPVTPAWAPLVGRWVNVGVRAKL